MTPELPPNVAVRPITERMVAIRGQNVILDSDLAAVYGVATKRLNEPLRSQIAAAKAGHHRHRRYLPYVFTEAGALMASGILNSKKAIEMSVYLVRAMSL